MFIVTSLLMSFLDFQMNSSMAAIRATPKPTINTKKTPPTFFKPKADAEPIMDESNVLNRELTVSISISISF